MGLLRETPGGRKGLARESARREGGEQLPLPAGTERYTYTTEINVTLGLQQSSQCSNGPMHFGVTSTCLPEITTKNITHTAEGITCDLEIFLSMSEI